MIRTLHSELDQQYHCIVTDNCDECPHTSPVVRVSGEYLLPCNLEGRSHVGDAKRSVRINSVWNQRQEHNYDDVWQTKTLTCGKGFCKIIELKFYVLWELTNWPSQDNTVNANLLNTRLKATRFMTTSQFPVSGRHGSWLLTDCPCKDDTVHGYLLIARLKATRYMATYWLPVSKRHGCLSDPSPSPIQSTLVCWRLPVRTEQKNQYSIFFTSVRGRFQKYWNRRATW